MEIELYNGKNQRDSCSARGVPCQPVSDEISEEFYFGLSLQANKTETHWFCVDLTLRLSKLGRLSKWLHYKICGYHML